MPMPYTSYTVRRHALEDARTWQFDDVGLGWQGGTINGRFDFNDIASVRLEWAATRFDFVRFQCAVTDRNGRTEKIVSTEYVGPANFTDRREDYRPFVQALIVAIAHANPNCKFVAGAGTVKYWISIATAAISLLFLTAVILNLGLSLTGMIIAQLLVLLFLLPLSLVWFKRNRPTSLDPTAIPANLLP